MLFRSVCKASVYAGLLGIQTSDDSQFLIKIGKFDTEYETFFREMDDTNSRIHGIFERFTNS